MRRAPRGTTRNVSLAIAGALLFVVGYFAGSRYAGSPLQGLSLVLLPEPPTLSPPTGVTLTDRWRLLLVGDPDAAGCRSRLTWLVQVRNRLAHRTDLGERIGILLVVPEDTQPYPTAEVPGWETAPVARAAALDLARQLGVPPAGALACIDSPPVLIDPQARLLALLPVDLAPATVAQDIEQVLGHFDP